MAMQGSFSLFGIVFFYHFCGSILPKLSSSQEHSALNSAQQDGPPLVCPYSLQVESIVSSPCCCCFCCSRANCLQPAQQESSLCFYSNYWQSFPKEGGGQGQFRLLRHTFSTFLWFSNSRSVISPKICPRIHPFFPKYAPVSTPSSYRIRRRVIRDTGASSKVHIMKWRSYV